MRLLLIVMWLVGSLLGIFSILIAFVVYLLWKHKKLKPLKFVTLFLFFALLGIFFIVILGKYTKDVIFYKTQSIKCVVNLIDVDANIVECGNYKFKLNISSEDVLLDLALSLFAKKPVIINFLTGSKNIISAKLKNPKNNINWKGLHDKDVVIRNMLRDLVPQIKNDLHQALRPFYFFLVSSILLFLISLIGMRVIFEKLNSWLLKLIYVVGLLGFLFDAVYSFRKIYKYKRYQQTLIHEAQQVKILPCLVVGFYKFENIYSIPYKMNGFTNIECYIKENNSVKGFELAPTATHFKEMATLGRCPGRIIYLPVFDEKLMVPLRIILNQCAGSNI